MFLSYPQDRQQIAIWNGESSESILTQMSILGLIFILIFITDFGNQ